MPRRPCHPLEALRALPIAPERRRGCVERQRDTPRHPYTCTRPSGIIIVLTWKLGNDVTDLPTEKGRRRAAPAYCYWLLLLPSSTILGSARLPACPPRPHAFIISHLWEQHAQVPSGRRWPTQHTPKPPNHPVRIPLLPLFKIIVELPVEVERERGWASGGFDGLLHRPAVLDGNNHPLTFTLAVC